VYLHKLFEVARD